MSGLGFSVAATVWTGKMSCVAEVLGEAGVWQELGRKGYAARGLAGGGLSEEHREKTGMCI